MIATPLNSPLGRQQIDAVSRHIMQNNINANETSVLECVR